MGHERQGLAYVKQLRPLLANMQLHRGMTGAYLSGGQRFESKIMQKREEVDAALTAADNELGPSVLTLPPLTVSTGYSRSAWRCW